jgi:hypothetical protein
LGPEQRVGWGIERIVCRILRDGLHRGVSGCRWDELGR